MTPRAYAVSWNLTARCNLFCAHCYLSAAPGVPGADELGTEECRQVLDDIARVNPRVVLILTGGEPLLRRDLYQLAARAREHGFTVVVGTNGVLLRERQARLLREHGVQGASLSLDSTDAARHDRFRRLPGAFQATLRAAAALRAEGLEFSLHMSVLQWNVAEIPAMIDLARELGARVLNLFFLVRTGRGEGLTDLSAAQYEEVLTALARLQSGGSAGRCTDPAAEDPWSVVAGRAEGLLIRAKCAPHFRRILYQLDPRSPLLANYAFGSCPAGIAYCRITPTGDVTPCPYLPVAAGNLRQQSFVELWERARIFTALREAPRGGRCGACEFGEICGGCRCRAYAASGDYLAEDPACAYTPGAHGGGRIRLPVEQTFGIEPRFALPWEPEARARLDAVPGFARGMVARAVEAYARRAGATVVTGRLLAEVRRHWGLIPGRSFAPRPGSGPEPRAGGADPGG